ncbi:hypothetical protein G6734_00045 [Polynucleobacter paneuropaeus]|nr:hypothetical protein [Polynucleobacter paneuropaeus]
MSIKQFNGVYDKKEDRIFFRFNTHDDQEFRFWLTRFITKGILSAVDQLMQKGLETKHNAQIAEVIKEFQKDTVAKTTKTNENYLGAQNTPLGEHPILVSAMNFNLSGDTFGMDFKLPDNKTLNIKLPTQSMQGMALLLRKLSVNAQWGITDDVETATLSTATVDPAGSKTNAIH